ncbi:hypothetical protein [Nitrosopumilus sp.]|uniref:hypothetical protein n=1 Tax=Nitrosopumilus sp. TaxID=2024843 RepID=UPI003D11621F
MSTKNSPRFNLKKLDGVISWSIFTGLMLAVLISTQVDISETGILFAILEALAKAFGYNTTLISIAAIIVTILELFILYFTIRNIRETHGLVGLIVSGLGFFGIMALVLGTVQFGIIGVFMIMAGYVIIRFVEDE